MWFFLLKLNNKLKFYIMFSDLASLLSSFNSKIQPQRDFGLCLEEIWQNISPDPKAIYGGFDFKKEEILIYVDNHALISNLQFSRLSLLKKLNHELNERKMSLIKNLKLILKK